MYKYPTANKLSQYVNNDGTFKSQVPRPTQNFQEYLQKEMQIFKEEDNSEIGSDDFEHYVDHKKRVSNFGYQSGKISEANKSPSKFDTALL